MVISWMVFLRRSCRSSRRSIRRGCKHSLLRTPMQRPRNLLQQRRPLPASNHSHRSRLRTSSCLGTNPRQQKWQQRKVRGMLYRSFSRPMQEAHEAAAQALALAEAAAHAAGAALGPAQHHGHQQQQQQQQGPLARLRARGQGQALPPVVFSGNHVVRPARLRHHDQEQERIRRRVRSGDPLLVPHRIIPCTCPAAAFLAGKCATLGSPCSVN